MTKSIKRSHVSGFFFSCSCMSGDYLFHRFEAVVAKSVLVFTAVC